MNTSHQSCLVFSWSPQCRFWLISFLGNNWKSVVDRFDKLCTCKARVRSMTFCYIVVPLPHSFRRIRFQKTWFWRKVRFRKNTNLENTVFGIYGFEGKTVSEKNTDQKMRFWRKVRFRKNTVLENAVFGIYGLGKTQFFRINCFRKKYGSENVVLKKS